MVESGCQTGNYQHGWICSRCDEYYRAGESERWFCQQCNDDLCFKCWPNQRPNASATVADMGDSVPLPIYGPPLEPVCLNCNGHGLSHKVVAADCYNECDMCLRLLRSGSELWCCTQGCEWCVCSSACAVAAADVHLAASVWRKLLTKEQPIRTWVAVHNLPAFVSMPERQLRALLFDKPKSRKRISAFVYDRDTAKWQLQQAQAKDIYIENQRQRAERKRADYLGITKQLET